MKNIESTGHVTGRSQYLDDIPVHSNALYGAIFTSPSAHGKIRSLDTSAASLSGGVVKVVTQADIPGKNEIGGIISDETLFAIDEVHYRGQPVALVVAKSEKEARRALSLIKIDIEEREVITDPRVAKEKGMLLIPSRTFRKGDVSKAWKECEYIFEGRVETGAQEHLYLETQGAYAIPSGNGALKIISSTQGPTLIQKISARVLGIAMNRIEVDVARLGGGFGGKEDQATGVAVMAALAAFLIDRPVKIVLQRGEDMQITGKRHPYSSDYRIGLSKELKIIAYQVTMYQNGGAAADLSPAIMERTLFHSTGAYNIPNTEVTVHSCRTNLPPNTAFRGFGAPQGMFAIEAAIARAGQELGIAALKIQAVNFLKENDEFQYGQKATGVSLGRCYETLESRFSTEKIAGEIELFNRHNERLKKGMAVMPVCFGISFTNTSMNHARALVHIYQDGSIGISTGAVEMGQGVNTKLSQVAAAVFSVDISRIKIETTNTTRVANTSPTAASSGADLNGNALMIACRKLLDRLISEAARIHNCTTDEIEIRNEIILKNGRPTETDWDKLVSSAFLSRVQLSETGHYATPTIYFNKAEEKGHPFAYHVYGTAIVTVLVDCLTGTWSPEKVLIVHDFGNSLNSQIDMGQIEGGFMQGLGWMTMEEIEYNNQGRLLTDSLSTYKVPDIFSRPRTFECIPLETTGPDIALLRSKAVGEPPFMYGIAVYFALKNAIQSFNPATDTDTVAPMTNERILMGLYSNRNIKTG